MPSNLKKQKHTSIFQVMMQCFLVFGILFTQTSWALAAEAPVPPANSNANAPKETAAPGAVEKSITDYLCTPDGEGKGTNALIFNCVNKLYRFSIAFGVSVAILFIIFAGYLYMSGSEKGVSEAKSIIENTAAGLLILFVSFLLLRQINPELTRFKSIQLPQIAPAGNTVTPSYVPDPPVDTSPTPTPPVNNEDPPVTAGLPGVVVYQGNPGADGRIVSAHRYGDGDWRAQGTSSDIQNNLRALRTGFDELKKKYSSLGYLQVFRPKLYGDHLRSIWEAYHLVVLKQSISSVARTGNACQNRTSPMFITQAHIDAYTAKPELITLLQAEYSAHFRYDTSPTTCDPDHAYGRAVDLKNYQTSSKFIEDAITAGLCHNIPGDPPHFVLKSAMPSGTKCDFGF